MPIKKTKAPPAAAEAFSSQLAEFLWVSEGDRSKVKQGYVGEMKIPSLDDLRHANERVQLHDAHPLYVLGLKDIAKDCGIDAATREGWRFFAGREPGKTLLGTVMRRGDDWRMTAGDYGERVTEVLAATHALDKLTQLEGGQYELRVLSVPGLSLEVFWMANVGESGPDLVVPIPSMPKQPIAALNKQPVYSMENFLEVIRPLARQRLAAGSKYGG